MRTTTSSALALALAACASRPPPATTPSNTTAAPPAPDALTVVLVIDRSGSMTGQRLTAARDGIETVRAALPPDAELGVIAFDSQPAVLLALTPARDRAAIATARAHLDAGGGTEYVGALRAADKMLQAAPPGRRLVVLLSDGEAPYDGVTDAVRMLVGGDHATVSAIGLGDADAQLLGSIADAGAGRVQMLTDVAQLQPALGHEIAAFLAP